MITASISPVVQRLNDLSKTLSSYIAFRIQHGELCCNKEQTIQVPYSSTSPSCPEERLAGALGLACPACVPMCHLLPAVCHTHFQDPVPAVQKLLGVVLISHQSECDQSGRLQRSPAPFGAKTHKHGSRSSLVGLKLIPLKGVFNPQKGPSSKQLGSLCSVAKLSLL